MNKWQAADHDQALGVPKARATRQRSSVRSSRPKCARDGLPRALLRLRCGKERLELLLDAAWRGGGARRRQTQVHRLVHALAAGRDDKILSLYARGMTVREIQGHLAELYGTEVSPDRISRVTDAVLDEVREWQNRPLEAVYPVVFFDALRVKIRDDGLVKNKAVAVTPRSSTTTPSPSSVADAGNASIECDPS
jgi:Transposase, Mutator family